MTEKEAADILIELQAMHRELADLRAEVLRRKAVGTKRARTRAKTVLNLAKRHPVSDLDIARALKRFRK